MNVSVLVPRAGVCPHRARAWAWIRPQYERLGYEVVEGHGDEERWCKADAVADALARSSGDVLVIADSDCWSERLPEAVQHVVQGGAWAVPYRKVYRLSETSSEAVGLGIPLSRDLALDRHHKGGGYHDGIVGGGIVVLPRITYNECPIDRRFIGWGGEDHSFGYALKTLYGEPLRLRSICWHFWHPKQPIDDWVGVCSSAFNEQLRLQYRAAYKAQDQARMRQLIGDGMEGNSTVTVRNRTLSTDAYGDPVEETVTESSVSALVAPQQEDEIHDRARAGIVIGLKAWFKPDVTITRDSQVLYSGEWYDVEGDPAYWASPTSGPKGIEVILRRATG